MSKDNSSKRTSTINMVAAALGGEGGGVFTNWVIDVAEQNQWLSQTTSLAGVAQRTGATVYYIELFPRSAVVSIPPVMSLFPAQGDIDIAVASEIAEAARMVQRGFVSKDRTTLIASTHRVYGITEKIDLSDGRVDGDALQSVASNYAKRFVHYDMLALAQQHEAVISAVMFGALAGADVLPFSKQSFEDVIRKTGKAVATNLAAFEASYQKAHAGGVERFEPDEEASDPHQQEAEFVLPSAKSSDGQALLQQLSDEFPAATHEIIYNGLLKTIDYQDYRYAQQYLNELKAILVQDKGPELMLTKQLARYLALWMCFEDIPRVAQFKTRVARNAKIREEVRAESGQIIQVSEFFRPRVEEACGLLPPMIADRLLASCLFTKFMGMFTGGQKLRTDTVSIFLILRFLASLRRFRRSGAVYQHEFSMIDRWLSAIRKATEADAELALALCNCGRMVKGYGDTRARTTQQICAILARVEGSSNISAESVGLWQAAALKDDTSVAFNQAIAAS